MTQARHVALMIAFLLITAGCTTQADVKDPEPPSAGVSIDENIPDVWFLEQNLSEDHHYYYRITHTYDGSRDCTMVLDFLRKGAVNDSLSKHLGTIERLAIVEGNVSFEGKSFEGVRIRVDCIEK